MRPAQECLFRGFRVLGLGFRGLGFRAFGFRVLGLGVHRIRLFVVCVCGGAVLILSTAYSMVRVRVCFRLCIAPISGFGCWSFWGRVDFQFRSWGLPGFGFG